MIIRDRPSLLSIFFILRGSIIQRILPQVLAVAAIAAALVLAHAAWPDRTPGFAGAPFALVGIALSVFLAFRNAACYDRWWEARRQWGEIIAASRDLARQTLILEPEAEAARRRLLGLAIAGAHALVRHLRPGAQSEPRTPLLPPALEPGLDASPFPPDFLLREMGRDLAGLRRDGHLTDVDFALLDGTLARITAAVTACERLRTTPVPFGYTLLLHRTAYIFCFLLPFGFADTLGWSTPFVAALVAYTFFGLDALGDELEEPFGTRPNDLPIAALARMIEINLREAMGERDLPPLPGPVNHILL